MARLVPPSAIAWPYRWLFALTECGEQRSPAARLCACARTRRTQPRRTQPRACTGAFRNRSLFYLCEGVVPPRIAGTLGARNLEAGVVSLIVMKLISVLKFRNRYFEITPLFRQRNADATPRGAVNLFLHELISKRRRLDRAARVIVNICFHL